MCFYFVQCMAPLLASSGCAVSLFECATPARKRHRLENEAGEVLAKQSKRGNCRKQKSETKTIFIFSVVGDVGWHKP
ncbi:hypothetical protein BJ741DRAFT_598331 [Chytriomyces cf. hyalinus JEL632]|nr:hypothetical protein BJ741DRAFT_598331 [Chytriomyces cf. hyalinus JEL632]